MVTRLFFMSLFLFVLGTTAAQTGGEAACPCCEPEYRQFDFWVGDWVAYDLQKKKALAGYNEIVLLQDSCVLQENWRSGNAAYTGTSYNWYERQNDQWHQVWIDNQGGSLQLSGAFKDGKMMLSSAPMTADNGKVLINRITWTPNPDGSVRQHWELSRDGGASWQTVFDGLYRRRQE